MTIGARFREVVASLRGRIGSIVGFALAFELLRFVVLAPLGAGMLRLFLDRWGRCSVGNFEVVAFLLSPPGWAAAIALGTAALTISYLEIGGLLLVLADRRATMVGVIVALGGRFFRLLALGLRQFVILLALAVPFLAAMAGVLAVLWSGHDLNGLLVLKPPIFWIGVVLGAGLGAGYAVAGGWLLLCWLFAVPTVLFEPASGAGEALRRSRQRTHGKRLALLGPVLVWLAAVLLLSSALMGGLHWGSGWVLDRAGLSLPVVLPVTAAVLMLHTLVGALLSVVSTASFAALLWVLYRETAGLPAPAAGGVPQTVGLLARLPARWLLAGSAAALVGAGGLICYGLLARVRLDERLEITAHRGGANLAPENTLAAVRQAIEVQADWAEIDVQRTADGAVVVLHDSDLIRVAGVPQRVAESTLAQLKALDVGSHFGQEFRGERVPTLDEVLAVVGRRIRLTIELKPGGPDDVAPLVQAVLDAVKRARLTDRCRLCSQSYDSLQLARQLEPGLPIGFIAGAQLGDLSGLDVNFLMVAQRLATRRLVTAAGARGMEVHAWTVNDPDALLPLLDRGVNNIISDDPAALRRRLAEVQQLSVSERLLLRARNLLAD